MPNDGLNETVAVPFVRFWVTWPGPNGRTIAEVALDSRTYPPTRLWTPAPRVELLGMFQLNDYAAAGLANRIVWLVVLPNVGQGWIGLESRVR